MVLSPNLQHGVRRQTFKEYASLDFGLDDIPIHFVAKIGMRREHDSLYLGLAPVTTLIIVINSRWSDVLWPPYFRQPDRTAGGDAAACRQQPSLGHWRIHSGRQGLQVDKARFLFPQLSIPHCFTYSAAHGNSNSVCLALRRRAIAV